MVSEQPGALQREALPPVGWQAPSDTTQSQRENGVFASVGLSVSTPASTIRASTAPAALNNPDASTTGGSLWNWPDPPSQELARPISSSLAVRRLVPTKSADGARKLNHSASVPSMKLPQKNHLGKRQLFLRPETSLNLDNDDLFLVRSVSTPSTKKRQPKQPQPQVCIPHPTQLQTQVHIPQIAHADVQLKVRVHTKVQVREDERWKDFAKEAAVWLKEFPKQDRPEAIIKMRLWVKAAGLDWNQWWEFIEDIDPDLDKGFSMHQRPLMPAQQSSVPHTFAKAYSRATKSRPKIAAVQMQLGLHSNTRRFEEHARPCTEDDWYAVASECMNWLDNMSSRERPAAMVKMRKWIVASGLEWDHWWDYCRRLRILERKEKQHLWEQGEKHDSEQHIGKIGHVAPARATLPHRSEIASTLPQVQETVSPGRNDLGSPELGQADDKSKMQLLEDKTQALEEPQEDDKDRQRKKTKSPRIPSPRTPFGQSPRTPRRSSQADSQSDWFLQEQFRKERREEWKKNAREYSKAVFDST